MKQSRAFPISAWIVMLLCALHTGCADTKPENSQKTGDQPSRGSAPASAPASNGPATSSPDAALAVFPLKMSGDQKTVKLPATVEDVVVGGGGRFLVCDLRSMLKLAVVDVSKGAIAGYVNLDDADDVVAAGAEKLVVIGRQSRMAKRYSLAGLKEEAEQTVPGEIPIVAAAMGAASRGPIYAACFDSNRCQLAAIDPMTFRLSEFQMTDINARNLLFGTINAMNDTVHLSVSGDGSLLACWRDSYMTCGVVVASTSAGKMGCLSLQVPGYACPDDFGDRIYTFQGVFNNRGETINEPGARPGVFAVAAIGAPYYLTVARDPTAGKQAQTTPPAENPEPPAKSLVSVFLEGEARPLTTLPLKDFCVPNYTGQVETARPAHFRRLFFIPAAEVIAEVTEPRSAIVLHRVDIQALWQHAAFEAPVVLTRPPKTVHVGEALTYQIKTACKSGKPVYRLDSGPEGMELSESGLLRWTPTSLPRSGMASAVISITDSDHASFHTVILTVKPAADSATAAGEQASAADIQLKLPADYDDVSAGGGGRFLVLKLSSLQKLAVVDLVTAKILGYVPFEGFCRFAAGADKLVIVDRDKNVVRRFNLETQNLEATQPLIGVRGATVVAMGAASHGPVLIAALGQRPPPAVMLNLDSLKPIECKMPTEGDLAPVDFTPINVSADGRVFAVWHNASFTPGLQIYIFNGREFAPSPFLQIPYAQPLPNEIGDRIYTGSGVYSNQLALLDEAVHNEGANAGPAIPAVQGPYYLRVLGDQLKSGIGHDAAEVYRVGQTQPLATLHDLPRLVSHQIFLPGRKRIPTEKTVYFVPDQKLVGMLPEQEDSIIIRRFDPEEALRKRGHH